MVTLVVMGLTFILTTAFYAFLVIWFVVRPIAEHMKENAEGAKALSEHVIVPVFGKRQREQEHSAR
jgi:hypothetical protein